MAGVKVVVTDREGKFPETGEVLELLVNEDLAGFEQFFMGLGNDSLAGPEAAAIKTYIWWKTHPEAEDGEATGS